MPQFRWRCRILVECPAFVQSYFDGPGLNFYPRENLTMRVAAAFELTAAERTQLLKWSHGRSTPARLVLRAKIVLAAAVGIQNTESAVALNCQRETIARWRNRFAGQPPGQRPTSLDQDAPLTGHRPVARLAHEA